MNSFSTAALMESNPHKLRMLLEEIRQFELSDGELGFLAWLFRRWQKRKEMCYYEKKYFQCNILNWWDKEFIEDSDCEKVRVIIFNIIDGKVGNSSANALIKAASIFDLAYPKAYYVGNGDSGNYNEDCPGHWKLFLPYKSFFEESLKISQNIVHEWITLAQVLWQHYRWTPNDNYEGYFSPETAGYFLSTSIDLKPSIPIHYYKIFKLIEKNDLNTGNMIQEAVLQSFKSNLGITYFYLAQFTQYHTNTPEKAIEYYHEFLALEGDDFLPQNNFFLCHEFAHERNYPPSSQEAYAEIARIYLENNQLSEAKFFIEKAIQLRPQNWQAPYELRAERAYKQGDIENYLKNRIQKIENCTCTLFEYGYLQKEGIGYYFQYAPDEKNYFRIGHGFREYFRMKIIDFRLEMKQIADFYLFELQNYAKASMFYKKSLDYIKKSLENNLWSPKISSISPKRDKSLESKIMAEIFESQLIIAMETHDYWQAKALAEKIIKKFPSRSSAYQYLPRIREKMGY
jgi:tetratricopeptide (TPR) repeat protein